MSEVLERSNWHIDLAARDEASVMGWRYTPRVIFDRGEGVRIFDVDGNAYYDMSSGMMSLALGHGHPELVETMREMAGKIVHQSSWFTNPWAIEFAELIASTLPPSLSVTNFAVTGSEANEIAMRMALGLTGRFDICSMVRGLHGGSLGVEAVTSVGAGRRAGLGPLTIPAKSNCIMAPLYYRAPVRDPDEWDRISLQLTEEMIEHTTSKQVAAFILEPIAIAGGMVVPSQRWMEGIRDIAKRWGALLIFDEVQLAPGRTGTMWSFEQYGITPDIMTWGKGMTAGLPVCGAATSREIADDVSGKLGLPWAGTYPQDPLNCAVALKQLQVVLRDDLVTQAKARGASMETGLRGLMEKHDCIGDVRGRALYQMLDIVTDRESRAADPVMAERIRYHAQLRGVLLICVKNFIRFCPPLIITDAELDDVMGRLDEAITAAERDDKSDLNVSGSGSLAAR